MSGLNIDIPIVPQATAPGPTGIYVGTDGDITTVTTDAQGQGFFSLFYIPDVNVRLGCRDPTNSARVATMVVDLVSDGIIKFVLPSPPSPPQNVTIESPVVPPSGGGGVDGGNVISWEPPANNGGASLGNYTVELVPESAVSGDRRLATAVAVSKSTLTKSVDPRLRSVKIFGLQAGYTYTVRVKASNAIGLSLPASKTLKISRISTKSPTVSPSTVSSYGSS